VSQEQSARTVGECNFTEAMSASTELTTSQTSELTTGSSSTRADASMHAAEGTAGVVETDEEVEPFIDAYSYSFLGLGGAALAFSRRAARSALNLAASL
jgi:hypothetical protein